MNAFAARSAIENATLSRTIVRVPPTDPSSEAEVRTRRHWWSPRKPSTPAPTFPD